MILDLGSFTRSGLMVDCVCPAETWGGAKHREGRGCKTRRRRKKTEITDLPAIAK